VPSLLRHSRAPFELIFLDIGSLDGTAEYLAGVAAAASVPVEVIRTATDLGIGEACAQAVKRAQGQYLVLLNNDTVVTDGWLNQLVGLANMSTVIGMVGPMSNYAAPPQLVEAVPYRIGAKAGQRSKGTANALDAVVNVEAVNTFAKEWRDKNRGKWSEVDRLGGFCLLLKREILARVGPLDEVSDLGLFDTDVLSMRARRSGYTLACCKDLFIHHFGSRAFAHAAPSVPAGIGGREAT
jgi:GT2 family glycosyltransferase